MKSIFHPIHSLLKALFFLSSFTLLAGCWGEKTDEELLQEDRDELKEMLTSNKILSYKFVKICARASVPSEGENQNPELLAFRQTSADIYNRFIRYDSATLASPGLDDFLHIYLDYLAVKDFVIKTDEDIFPPLTHSIAASNAGLKTIPTSGGSKQELLLIQNMEHAGLSVLVLLSKEFGRPISLYECAETEPDLLPDSESKTLLRMLRAFIFFEKGLYYLSEDEFSGNISWLEGHSKIALPFSSMLFDWHNKETKSQANKGLHALNVLFRGFDRLMMERDIDEERALQDFEAFVKDMEEMGVENELTWTVAAYLYMKKEDSEKAIVELSKLRNSKLIGEKERSSIDETIGYLKDREPGKALNRVYDNVFIGRIAVRYALALLSEIDWRKLMIENDIPHANEAFKTFDRVETVIAGIDQYTNMDSLAADGKGLLKSVEEGGKGLLEKAADWWE